MRLRTKYFVIILQIALILTSSTILKAYGNNMQIPENRAIEIANNEAKKLGYSIEVMQVKVTHYNTPLNEYVSDSEEEYHAKIRSKLKNKGYWTVYYSNQNFKKGGDLCIFIDSSNGGVITYIRGK